MGLGKLVLKFSSFKDKLVGQMLDERCCWKHTNTHTTLDK